MSLIDNTYIPSKDQELANWALNFSTLITANYAAYGLTTGQQSAFATLRIDFISKLATAINPSTRTKPATAAKNAAKALMVANARTLANIIQNNPLVTNTQRQDLGLTVRDRFPTPIGPPTTKPIVTVQNSTSNALFLRFADELTPASRSLPPGAQGMQLFAKVGTVPSGVDDCAYVGQFNKNTSGPATRGIQVDFAPADVGKTAYLIARWISRRGLVGPVSNTVSHTVAA